MNKVIEKSAKTIDEAVALALEELGVSQDSVTIEVVNEGKKGFLGLGSIDATVRVTLVETPVTRAEDYIKGIFKEMGIEAGLESSFEDEKVNISIDCDEETVGMIIGRRGDNLDALQYLTSLVVNKGEENYIRVSLDIEGYREKREETLIRLAKSKAMVVAKTHRSVTLEPMNPNERRIIHSALQEFRNIYTYSIGDDPNRKIVIAPKKKEYGSDYKSKYRYNRKENECVIDGTSTAVYEQTEE
ncbi:MAG: RNA-binding cell elongation regulator Jag/EloR [Clostridia bacterium]